ncbi:MAG: DNA integrity scanning diadenylate cyclase DisA [Sulfobacillus sp.]
MDQMLDILAKVSPGTLLREAIDNIIKARTGGLLVIGGEPDIDADCDGGFMLDVPFNAAAVYELAKMDGAILLDRDLTRIRRANVELIPKIAAPSTETGMRHRTAERIARTRDALVVTVSQRRSVVTLYVKQTRYVLQDLSFILTKATGALASLSRYDRLCRSAARRLTEAEIRGDVVLEDVVELLRRMFIAMQIRREIRRYVVELGSDGHLVDLQLEEYPDLRREWHWLWMDYQVSPGVGVIEPETIDATLWSYDQWVRALGHCPETGRVEPRGYRVLHAIPRLSENIIGEVVHEFGSLAQIRRATTADLDRVRDVGPQRARAIWKVFHDVGDTGTS